MFNYAIVRQDGTTITGQEENWASAIRHMKGITKDSFYRTSSQCRFFIGNTADGLQEYTFNEIQTEAK